MFFLLLGFILLASLLGLISMETGNLPALEFN